MSMLSDRKKYFAMRGRALTNRRRTLALSSALITILINALLKCLRTKGKGDGVVRLSCTQTIGVA